MSYHCVSRADLTHFLFEKQQGCFRPLCFGQGPEPHTVIKLRSNGDRSWRTGERIRLVAEVGAKAWPDPKRLLEETHFFADRLLRQRCCLERIVRAKDTYGVSGKDKRAATTAPADLSSREAVERFREAAADFTKEGTRSKESAMKVLVKSGIYRESGQLSKNYRS
jgi:hypothetical protein